MEVLEKGRGVLSRIIHNINIYPHTRVKVCTSLNSAPITCFYYNVFLVYHSASIPQRAWFYELYCALYCTLPLL